LHENIRQIHSLESPDLSDLFDIIFILRPLRFGIFPICA